MINEKLVKNEAISNQALSIFSEVNWRFTALANEEMSVREKIESKYGEVTTFEEEELIAIQAKQRMLGDLVEWLENYKG